MNLIQAIILAIVEGLTEFLPVSSTGHMILASSFMGIASNNFVKLFTIAIQLGCILSVLVLYTKRFLKSFNFYVTLVLAFIPSAILGLLLSDLIDELLESPLVVAIMLVLGGFVLIGVDKWFKKNEVETNNKQVSPFKAVAIGFFQTIAMIPGVSRSAATIIGGLTQGLNRKTAAEFSFFLAVPTMFAATAYKLYKFLDDGNSFTNQEYSLLLIGSVVAFVVGLLAIKSFINFLSKKGFKIFGYYRIILGSIIIILIAAGYNLEIV